MSSDKFYTQREEKANYITHALGLIMAVIASYILIKKAVIANNTTAIIAYIIFSLGMISCMLASTAYHYAKNVNIKRKLRHIDHASIYLLIAASYSPFTFILLQNDPVWSYSIFALIWIIAIVGITLSFRPLKRNSHLKTISYVMMGLVILIAFKPLVEAAKTLDSVDAIYWLIIGGMFYIVGSIIYATAKREYIHALFHIFVILGLASHINSAYILPI
ncbi:MAG: hemolysin III family protein [Proteiniphilum sp.]|nr:hemolysin III family protein [Proteiniphilum sp.]